MTARKQCLARVDVVEILAILGMAHKNGDNRDGPMGSMAFTGTLTFNGTKLTAATYKSPSACGLPSDTGTIIGQPVEPFSGTYSGMFCPPSGSCTDAVVVTMSQPNPPALTVTGTDNGANTARRLLDRRSVRRHQCSDESDLCWCLCPTANDFLVFTMSNGTVQYVGTLSAGTNAAQAKHGLFVGKQSGSIPH
jgi:hypothetical protein